MRSTATNSIKEITELAEELPDRARQELLDFALFLKTRKRGFSYKEAGDSAEYVKKLRSREGGAAGSGESFLKELIEWQRSNS